MTYFYVFLNGGLGLRKESKFRFNSLSSAIAFANEKANEISLNGVSLKKELNLNWWKDKDGNSRVRVYNDVFDIV